MPRRTLLTAVIALVAVTAVAVGWWWSNRGPDVVPAARSADPACTRAVAAFPSRLGRLDRRPIDVPAATTYGDPAVVVRCGAPALGPTTDECVSVSGVDWVVHPLGDGTRLTTYGRSPALEVLVPQAHGPAPLVLPGLDAAARSLPENGRRCLG